MKIYNQQKSILTPLLANYLLRIRKERNFNAQKYVESKVVVLNEYFKSHKITAAVVGLSGGIDSAVVLSLLVEATKDPHSPFKKVYPLLLPLVESKGATNQSSATQRGEGGCSVLNLKANIIDLSKVEKTLRDQVEPTLNIQGDNWAVGQLVAYLRTPTLYYATSLLSAQGERAVVGGTTNQDEGAYLGYFGKASDGLVDVQVISDLHKSEVFKVGEYLKVPESILEVPPSGDMFDGRVDEEVFGASYDFVELYLSYLRWSKIQQSKFLISLDESSAIQFNQGLENLEKMHYYNGHKYLGASPAVHLDILEGNVPGGWKNNKTILTPVSKNSSMVNLVELPKNLLDHIQVLSPAVSSQEQSGVLKIKEVLNSVEIKEILSFLDQQVWVPTGKDGYTKTFNELEKAGSWRISTYSEDLAKILWSRMAHLFNPVVNFKNQDHDGMPHTVWTPMGLNPLFRFIKYEKGGELIPHYDAPVELTDQTKTLMSVIIYLTTNSSGATRFLMDPQDSIPFSERKFRDWTHPAPNNIVKEAYLPQAGGGLIFPHRLLHEGLKTEETKIILRTDIVFKRGGI